MVSLLQRIMKDLGLTQKTMMNPVVSDKIDNLASSSHSAKEPCLAAVDYFTHLVGRVAESWNMNSNSNSDSNKRRNKH